METQLSEFMTQGVFAFILIFVRIGSALTIMPGIGDTLTPQNIRLYIALAISLVLSPLVAQHVPNPVPDTMMLFALIVMEFIIGLFIGTVARCFMLALDTAGMVISISSGLSNAQLFNPALATQGSLIGTVLTMMGLLLLFATNMHHLLFYGLVGSYEMFPIGTIPDTGSMMQLITEAVAASFLIGFQLSAPFVVVSLMLYIGMGVLSRLMPQVQIFMVAMPLQIVISLILLGMVIPGIALFWETKFEDHMMYFLSTAE